MTLDKELCLFIFIHLYKSTRNFMKEYNLFINFKDLSAHTFLTKISNKNISYLYERIFNENESFILKN